MSPEWSPDGEDPNSLWVKRADERDKKHDENMLAWEKRQEARWDARDEADREATQKRHEEMQEKFQSMVDGLLGQFRNFEDARNAMSIYDYAKAWAVPAAILIGVAAYLWVHLK
jgi:hypothetical protein